MSFDACILNYLRKVLDEHTIPLADNRAGLVEARWLIDLIHKVEEVYRLNGLL